MSNSTSCAASKGLQTSHCMCCSSKVHVFLVNAMSLLLGTMSHAVRPAGAADNILHALSSLVHGLCGQCCVFAVRHLTSCAASKGCRPATACAAAARVMPMWS